MYIVNKNGYNIPPCLAPFVTVKKDEVFLPHFTQSIIYVVYTSERVFEPLPTAHQHYTF